MRESIDMFCPICAHTFKGRYYDICPKCDWMIEGWEMEAPEDFYSDANRSSILEARKKFAKGLNVWGKPLKKTDV